MPARGAAMPFGLRHAALAASCLIGLGAGMSPAHADAYHDTVDAYFKGEWAAHPTEATSNGLHAYDALLDDQSGAAHAAESKRLRDIADRLRAVDPGTLSPADRDDRDVLMGQLDGQRLLEDDVQPWRHAPGSYVDLATNAVYSLIERDFAPLPDRMKSVIAREKLLPPMLADARANIADVPPVFVDVALENLDGAIGFISHDVPSAFATVSDPALKSALAASTKSTVAALTEYKSFLVALKPRAHGSFVLGPKSFARLLASDLIDASADTVLAAGQAQLARDRAAFQATAKRIDPKAPDHALAEIAQDHPDATHLVSEAKDQLDGLRRFIVQHHIVTLPSDLLPVVAETPAFSRALVFGEMDPPGPFETVATTAYYYITPPDTSEPAADQQKYLEYFNRSLLLNLSVHEALPGHFVQFLYARAHPEWSIVRKTAHSYTATEGWAHYSEQMMPDQGLNDGDAKLRLAQLQDALLRDCRLIASVSMHTKGMSLADASTMMQTQCFQPKDVGYKEARRGTADPGYFSYTLGKLMILKLRADMHRSEGVHFSLNRFHDRFLAAGLVPIPIIRRELTGHDGAPL